MVGTQTADISKSAQHQGQFCQLCNAWRGSLGLEPTPELFIDHIVQIFREVKRVLRKDGTVWLNLGDSYNSGTQFNHHSSGLGDANRYAEGSCRGDWSGHRKMISNLKPKDLIGIPWRVALALQADGWWLRSALPWVKRSTMPESVDDRPASALEYMFLLTKSAKCYFDMDAIKIKSTGQSGAATNFKRETKDHIIPNQKNPQHRLDRKETRDNGGRNFRNTDLFYQSIEPPHGMIFCGDEPVGLDVNPQAMKEAHFATFPEKLIEPCILAGTSEKGCCVECGAPWERVVEKINPPRRKENRRTPPGQTKNYMPLNVNDEVPISKTIGWQPGCECDTPATRDWKLAGRGDYCTILDPFFGSGTTALVAHKHGRNFIGIELSEPYLRDIAVPRIEKVTKQLKLFN